MKTLILTLFIALSFTAIAEDKLVNPSPDKLISPVGEKSSDQNIIQHNHPTRCHHIEEDECPQNTPTPHYTQSNPSNSQEAKAYKAQWFPPYPGGWGYYPYVQYGTWCNAGCNVGPAFIGSFCQCLSWNYWGQQIFIPGVVIW